MKKRGLFSLLVLAFSILLTAGALALDTVYVNDSGTGDGTRAETPLGSLRDAIASIASEGGQIVITDAYTLSEPFEEPAHSAPVTITGGKLILNHSQYSRYFLSGPVTFENLRIEYGADNAIATGMIVARFNTLVLGDGLEMADGKLFVVGGYQFPTEETIDTKRNSQITIKSGMYSTVVGFSRGNGANTFRGTSYITIDGGVITNLYGASLNGQYSGSTEITVNGGSIENLFTGGDQTRRLNGDATVTINGGTIGNLNINNVMGHAAVYYLGGSVTSMSKQTAEDILHAVQDGKADLTVRKGISAKAFANVFDTAVYEDGTPLTGETPTSGEYELLDDVPEKTSVTEAKIYVSNAGQGDGKTADTALGDLEAAYAALDGADGTIVLINEIKLDADFTEPAHRNKIVITSYDGDQYYNGSINFGENRRFFFNGDTTFENTRFEYANTLLMVGRFHNVAFGTGLQMPETEPGVRQLFVLGGYQFDTAEPILTEVNGSITIESGNYYSVIGYTRGVPTDTSYSFKGKQTIHISGGVLYRVYGGGVQANTFDAVQINISGGTISDSIIVGGDQFYYANTAILNITGGQIQALHLQNVIQSTEVNWVGGTIESMDIIYGKSDDGTTDVAALAEYAVYTLNYKNVTPSDEMCALFDTIGLNPAITPEKTDPKFHAVRTYDNQFSDVTADKWFYEYVKTAYEYGLVNGMSDATFSPDHPFTVAQALTAAANIHTAYCGASVAAATPSQAWYAPYAEYCIENGIIIESQFDDYTRKITRKEMAVVFANILPDEEYTALREGLCPDITPDMDCYLAVTKLYQAGIISGDDQGNYRPDDEMIRSEACVIFARIAAAGKRVK